LDGIKSDFEATARALVDSYFAPDVPLGIKDKSLRRLLSTGSVVTYADYAACDAFDVRERMQNISCPTLVVCGRADRMTPVKYSEYLARAIPLARLAVIENAGHMVMLEKAQEFNQILGAWLMS
jgi:pimeloyl-ACP methyl ester carboxylesterase